MSADDDFEHARRRARVAQVQRGRVLAGLYEVWAERGVSELTVAAIVSRAGVSRRTFYEQFDSAEECLLAALQQALELAEQRVRAAVEPPGSWRERVRDGLAALLALCDEQPLLARLLLVDSLTMGPRALVLREQALAPAIAAVAAGGEDQRASARLSPLTAEVAVGGLLGILHARLLAPPPWPPLLSLLGELTSLLVLPYLGPLAAAAELEAPVPEPVATSGRVPVGVGDTLQDLDMRLTYRTIRVLGAVAGNPGCSNRTAGRGAGVEDQGQMSKLLRRLSDLGLIVNTAADTPAGTANAWHVTARGRELSETFAAHDTPS